MDTRYIHLPSIYTHRDKVKDGGGIREGDTEKMEKGREAQKRDEIKREDERKGREEKQKDENHFSWSFFLPNMHLYETAGCTAVVTCECILHTV